MWEFDRLRSNSVCDQMNLDFVFVLVAHLARSFPHAYSYEQSFIPLKINFHHGGKTFVIIIDTNLKK